MRPRTGAAGSARSLLRTVLGELVWPSGTDVRTTTLVHLLAGLDVDPRTARQAIARAATSGWIEAERHGRETRWTLTPKLDDIFRSGSGRVYSLSDPFPEWDRRWLAVLPTVPAAQRGVRRTLYAGLRWAGLGNPVPGLWVTPHTERADEVAQLVDGLGLRAHTAAFVGSVADVGIAEDDIVARGWDLAELGSRYEELERDLAALSPRTADETMLAHLRVTREYQVLPRTDPQLPEALLPDWIGRRVARRIETLRARWTPTVRARYAELNSPR